MKEVGVRNYEVKGEHRAYERVTCPTAVTVGKESERERGEVFLEGYVFAGRNWGLPEHRIEHTHRLEFCSQNTWVFYTLWDLGINTSVTVLL